VLNPLTGEVIKKFDTGVADSNGLSTPAAVDEDLNGVVDYVFAGDLKGNMWKFDLRGASTDDWKFSYQNGSTPEPLISVRNDSGEIQPITAAPEVTLDCANLNEGRGLMVIFGTGKYLGLDDLNDTTAQSFYGIWDWGEVWEKASGFDVAKTKYLGTVNADKSLSNLGSNITLVHQTFIQKDSQWGVLTDIQPAWYNPFKNEGSNVGWTIDMEESRERSILQPTVVAGAAILISMTPSNSPCTAGGSSGTYTVSTCSGGHYSHPVYDVNGNGKLDKNDTIDVNGVPQFPQWHPHPRILLSPLPVSDKIYQQDTLGNLIETSGWDDKPGMFFWRVLGQ
jgi:type IV pilus assembly protein PilY1